MQYIKNMKGMDIYKYFKEKIISDLTVEELSFIHLDLNSATHSLKEPHYVSSNLYDLVETVSASFLNRRTRIYVPIMTCFAILDQIGSIYSLKNSTSTYQNGIKRALSIFSSINDEKDLNSLVTLRHGLLHNGSLININYNIATNVIFRMKQDLNQLLKHPNTKWDGIFHDTLTDYITYINLKELQDLTIEIINKCKEELLNDNLEISINDEKEFFYKYLFIGERQEDEDLV